MKTTRAKARQPSVNAATEASAIVAKALQQQIDARHWADVPRRAKDILQALTSAGFKVERAP